MFVSLSSQTQELIASWMKKGGYASPADLVQAALASLDQLQRSQKFAPGELDQLLAVGEEEIEAGDVLDGEAVFQELRQQSREVDWP